MKKLRIFFTFFFALFFVAFVMATYPGIARAQATCDIGYCGCAGDGSICHGPPSSPPPTGGNHGGGDRTDAYIPGNCPVGTAPDFTVAPNCSVVPPNCCIGAADGHVTYSWGSDHQDFWGCVWPCKAVCQDTSPSTTTLISPANGASLHATDQTLSVTLDWSDIGSWGTVCTATRTNLYQVWIWSTDNQNWRALADVSGTSQYTFTANAGVVYYWTVYSYNGVYFSTNLTPWYFSVSLPDDPWWQVKDGDVTTNYSISSKVPTATLFNVNGAGGFPGVPVYGTTFNLTSSPDRISASQWTANTTTRNSRLFDYTYFSNLIPEGTLINDIGTLATGGTATDGYEWYKIAGNLDINSDIDFGSRKVILFVDGVLNINSKINLTDNSGFFGAFVSGGININPSVSGANSIEGLYLSDGVFNTGAGNVGLHIRGSVVANGGMVLARDLTDDSAGPGELFEFAPDQILLFPEKLGFRDQRWLEVAP
jgi:hypothetical protein